MAGGGSYLQLRWNRSMNHEQQIQGKKIHIYTTVCFEFSVLGTLMQQYKIGQTSGCSQQSFAWEKGNDQYYSTQFLLFGNIKTVIQF